MPSLPGHIAQAKPDQHYIQFIVEPYIKTIRSTTFFF